MGQAPKPQLTAAQSEQKASSQIPVIAGKDGYGNAKIPILSKTKAEFEWSFSFQYFDQIQYFGLDTNKADGKWFISLLHKFRDLCKTDLTRFLKDISLRQDWRYHKIDWGSRNIPIKRSDCNWVNREFLDNEEEFPFVQFHVSKALGRVVGFWGPGLRMFYVVLLDPMHNIQPSKFNDYKVDDCYPLSCTYSSVLLRLNAAYEKGCQDPNCILMETVKNINDISSPSNFIYCELDDSYQEYLDKYSLKQIMEAGIFMLES